MRVNDGLRVNDGIDWTWTMDVDVWVCMNVSTHLHQT